MDFLLPLMVCLVLGAPIGLAGAALIGRGPEAMSGLFVGYRGLGWPHGVQEEDPSGGWTWHLPPVDAAAQPQVALSAEPVAAATDVADLIGRQVHPAKAVRPELIEGADGLPNPLMVERVAVKVRAGIRH